MFDQLSKDKSPPPFSDHKANMQKHPKAKASEDSNRKEDPMLIVQLRKSDLKIRCKFRAEANWIWQPVLKDDLGEQAQHRSTQGSPGSSEC